MSVKMFNGVMIPIVPNKKDAGVVQRMMDKCVEVRNVNACQDMECIDCIYAIDSHYDDFIAWELSKENDNELG